MTEGAGDVAMTPRLYLVRKSGKVTRSIEIPMGCDSLNHADAFILDNGEVVYTWFGEHCSPFEKSKAAEVAHNIVISRNGHAHLEEDVGDKEEFWEVMGGIGDIKDEGEFEEHPIPEHQDTKMYVLSDADSFIKVEERSADKENLESGDVCLVDTGNVIFVWIDSGSSLREQSQAMQMAQQHIASMSRGLNTTVIRVLEGQEGRVQGFNEAF